MKKQTKHRNIRRKPLRHPVPSNVLVLPESLRREMEEYAALRLSAMPREEAIQYLGELRQDLCLRGSALARGQRDLAKEKQETIEDGDPHGLLGTGLFSPEATPEERVAYAAELARMGIT